MAHFPDAKIGETAPVWVAPDGWDDFAWVSDPEYFEEGDERIETVCQEWRLISEQRVVWTPRAELCPACGDGDDDCGTCSGTGEHPWAGTWQEIDG